MRLDRVADGDLHTLADFVELYCLLTDDRLASLDDVDDYAFDVCDKPRGALPLRDAWQQMAWRAQAFGDAYPFRVSTTDTFLEAKPQLAPAQEGYAYLLLCASLPYFDRRTRNELTEGFEHLSHAALRRVFPAPAEVRLFGKATSEYGTRSKAERLTQLARDLGGWATVATEQFRPHDSGDGGIDIVMWHSLDTVHRENQLTALAQCACSRSEWERKQGEIGQTRLSKLLHPTAPWVEIMCIPFCFRDNQGLWAVDSAVNAVVLFDRLRLMNSLVAPEDWQGLADHLPSVAGLLQGGLDYA